MKQYPMRINLIGEWVEMEADAGETLLHALREKLAAVEVKNGCGKGDCGACTVILNGNPVNACLTLALQADGKEVVTIKGIGSVQDPHPIQKSFVEKGAIQCGFCTAGHVLSAKVLLDKNPAPTRDDITEAISGNLCRCTGYTKIVEAIEDSAMNARSGKE